MVYVLSEKWVLALQDGSKWAVHVLSNGILPGLSFANVCLISQSQWSGTTQAGKLPKDSLGDGLYDSFIGNWITSITLVAEVSSQIGTYSLKYENGGNQALAPLIFALPHHVASLAPGIQSAGIKLHSGMHGVASGYQSYVLKLIEPSLPSDIGFLVDDDRAIWNNVNLFAIKKAVTPDILRSDFLGCNTYSTYFNGKCLAKSARLCLVARDVVQDEDLFNNCIAQLEAVMDVFADNAHYTTFDYDPNWKGIVADAGYTTSGADFGGTDYNDHHFHYGYIIYAAAVLTHLDPTWAGLTRLSALTENLIRGCANPSEEDQIFPQFRSMDWYVGHSIAHGVATDFADGKDEESSSEDYNLAYAIQLYGKATQNAQLQALGALMGAVKARSVQSYMLLGPDNIVQPSMYNPNYVSGIHFANKMAHIIFFGGQTQYVHGIHLVITATAYADVSLCEEGIFRRKRME
ncbi:endo-1,3(4)-beta-glucanase [Protomyces lactucae-debilis]|uniref:glucan endo-1,3-beta-D-glucosidase n=1 Tax=Protomyces lactucae-debilis TaxID=2754530 RepID=A0A1Y2ESN1_PROLT|nr:endo-1,3(4)-beta-glucanase [Protomyces lactucae-debilis]ORY74581.1 endo-1,3(4)-beta-glucanase [Protomyces lactucae-debilis]